MSRKAYTGGPLNLLNGKMGISAPNKSVPVSKLVRAHKPKSASELEKLIEDHIGGGCKCGVVSQGSVKDFGENLYQAQKKFWGEYRFSIKECIQWEYDLFIIQMLKGNRMEDICRNELTNILPENYVVTDSSTYIDENVRVDLEVTKNGNKVAGIQVKPKSFNKIRSSVQQFNKNANKNYGYPVIYADYDYDSEEFQHLDIVADELKKL